MNTQARSPARAAWAATAFARLPVDAQAATSYSNRKAAAMATATTRSLNDQVGFMVSFLMYREDRPNARPSLAARISGVKPGDRSISGTRLTGRSGSDPPNDGGPDSMAPPRRTHAHAP